MSPYRSLAQERFFHSSGAKKNKNISDSLVQEMDELSAGKALPERATSQPLPDTVKKRIAVKRALKSK